MWPGCAYPIDGGQSCRRGRSKTLIFKEVRAGVLCRKPSFGGQRSIQLSYGCVAVHLADWPGLGNGPAGLGVHHSRQAASARRPLTFAVSCGVRELSMSTIGALAAWPVEPRVLPETSQERKKVPV